MQKKIIIIQNRNRYFFVNFNNKKNLILIRKSKNRIAKFEINNVFLSTNQAYRQQRHRFFLKK